MKKRRSAVLMGILALSVALSACGGKSAEGDGSSAGGSNDKVTLNLALWDETLKDVVNKTIEIYKKDHPNVEVKVTYTPFADYWPKLKTSLAGKSGPDVFWMNGPNFYSYAAPGLLKDMQPLIEADKLDTSQYTEALIDMYTYEDHLYGLPYFLDNGALYYNKELFDQAGLKYPDSSWTWDTIEENAAKLTDKEKGIYGYIVPMGNQTGSYNYINQAGGYMISPDKTKSGFNTPETLSAYKWMKEMMDAGYSPSARQQLESGNELPEQLFGSGKAAMFPALSVKVPTLHEMLGDKLGVAPLPAGKKKASIVHGLSWAINNNTKHEKEAWDLVKVFSGQAGEKIMADSGFSIPALKGTEEGWLKSMPSVDMKVFVDSLQFGVPYPISEKTIEWQNVENREIEAAFLGKKSFEDALKTIDEKMNEILASENK